MSSIIFKMNKKTITVLIYCMTTLFFSSIALATTTHTIGISAEILPNGQLGYKMDSHSGSSQNYPTDAVIPGPSLFVQQGDTVNISLTNNTNVPVGFNIPGIQTDPTEAAPGSSYDYSFIADQPGTHPYYDEGSGLLGLFGALVVNAADGSVQSYVDGDGTITPTDAVDLDKEYVMFMVGSTFWATEISSGTQTPLWTNPVLGATLDDIVRFHILSIGHDHTFHLHAHRWLDEIAPAIQGADPHIIDVKILSGKADSHTFTVKAGTGVGAGMWHLHCHVVSHMESGMAARFRVDEPGATSGVSVAGATPYGAILLSSNQSDPGVVTFEITDEPGSWFRSTRGDAIVDPSGPLGALNINTRSLEVMAPGSSAHFIMSDTNAVHTITTLLWPSDADTGEQHSTPFDQTKAYKGGGIVKLDTPGLYVFTCKIHPYMFGAVIVDDPATEGMDLGESIDLVVGLNDLPTTSDLATRLLRTFFVVTAQDNWQDYTPGAAPWHVAYPDVPVRLTDGAVLNLKEVLEARYGQDIVLASLSNPTVPGVGEVWINTQFEKTANKTKPGTITVLDTTDWTIKRKISLPAINMNHPHNMWSNRDQSVVFQTQWFDNKLTFINQTNGQMIDNIRIGEAPSHVMTMPDSDDITVAINGENRVVTIPAGTTTPDSSIPTQLPGQIPANPHGHWITPEGKVVTPNINTSDAGFYDGNSGEILARPAAGGNFPHGPHPIAIGVGNNKIYAANLLDHSLSVYDFDGNPIPVAANDSKPFINLIAPYNPVTGDGAGNSGILPIQTPVDPTGSVVVTANTGGTITIVDTSTDTVVAVLPCDPGCHGANFGAKAGGGYYAYVSSKFSNRLIVVDPDPNGDGDFSDADIAGAILMADNSVPNDDAVTGLAGYGGQGVLPIPNVYNGWVQNLPDSWKSGLTADQLTATVPVP